MPLWAFVSFLIWVGYGIWQWRRSEVLLARLHSISSSKRPMLATVCLFGGAGLLVLTLYIAWSTNLLSDNRQFLGFITITGGGLLFVHLQTLAAAMIMSLAVTPRSAPTSQDVGKKTS